VICKVVSGMISTFCQFSHLTKYKHREKKGKELEGKDSKDIKDIKGNKRNDLW